MSACQRADRLVRLMSRGLLMLGDGFGPLDPGEVDADAHGIIVVVRIGVAEFQLGVVAAVEIDVGLCDVSVITGPLKPRFAAPISTLLFSTFTER